MTKLGKKNHDMDNQIAIIGMACKFPGANDIHEFWDILKNGKETISHFTVEQLKANGVPEKLSESSNYIGSRGILDEPSSFDSQLFNFSTTDLGCLNTPARTFLQITWQALEDAGISPRACCKSTSVFVGANDTTLSTSQQFLSPMMSMGGIKELHYSKSLATLIAYHFGLQGTAVNLHTACSTSLVALINACQNLILDNCDLAIAGGVSIDMPQELGYLYEEGGFFSSDGHCRAFDAKASGAVISNGAGVVILKRLKNAIQDRDNIYAVIRGYSMNNDGNQKPGFFAPGINGQFHCIRKAWENAEIEPSMIDYIEAHGAATLIGDPIEIFALKKAFQKQHNSNRKKCGIGSVKTNIGHTTLASGVAGIIKTALILKKRAIVPSLHFEVLNPNIIIKNSPFYITTKYKEFPKRKKDIFAGISNFGLGGTNAHMVLKNNRFDRGEYSRVSNRKYQILTLSAMSEESLIKLIKKYLNFYFQEKLSLSKLSLADSCFTANCGRSSLKYRTYMIFNSYQTLIEQFIKAEVARSYCNVEKVKIIFMFSDQRDTFQCMAKNLYKNEPLFAKFIDECLNKLTLKNQLKVKNSLFKINKIDNKNSLVHLSCFVFEYSLAKYLSILGVVPDVVIAKGLGEFVAAVFTGMMELDDIISLLETANPFLIDNKSKKNVSKFKKISVKNPSIPYLFGNNENEFDKNNPLSFDSWFSQICHHNKISNNEKIAKLAFENFLILEIGPDCSWQFIEKQQNCVIKRHDILNNLSDGFSFVNLLGHLWCYGININWTDYYRHENRNKISLPTYCFSNS
jgi:acyl transferase domain-containing protein